MKEKNTVATTDLKTYLSIRNRVLLGVLLGLGLCSHTSVMAGENYQRDVLTAERVAAYNSAAQITVSNSLPPLQTDGGREIRYNIIRVDFCGNRGKVGSPGSATRCVRFFDMIPPGMSKTFYISSSDFRMISEFGNGRGEFFFGDDRQLMSSTSFCWGASDFNLDSTEYSVDIYERGLIAYSCSIH